jgi:hypothetical protein
MNPTNQNNRVFAGNIQLPSTDAFSGIKLSEISNGISPGLSAILKLTAPAVSQPQAVQPSGSTGTFGGTATLPTQYSMANGVVTPTGQSYTAPSKINPQNYSVPASSVVDSTLISKPSPGALQDAYNAKQLALRNGTDANLIPSDSYYTNSIQSDLYKQVGNLSQYSPDEQAALAAKAENDAKIYNTQLAARRQIKQLQEDGAITKVQAQAFISEAQRRADAQAADQAGLGSYLNASLDVLGKIRGNQLTAAQSQFGMIQPTQVGIGSTLYNPITGVQYQPGGEAQSSIAQALVDGTMSPNQIPSGVNPAVVFQQANELSMKTKGVPFNANESQANYSATQAALTQSATTFRALSNAQQTAVTHLDDLSGYFDQISKTGIPVANKMINWVSNALGSEALQSYNTALQAARGEIAKVLSGGGAPTDSDKIAANAVLPDNMSPGQFKGAINASKLLMQQKIAEYSNLGNVPQFGQQQQASGGNVIQTKVGAVDNSWFN